MMANSLKAYAPLLAWRLGTTSAALYERQRALVREGILDQSEGRGPGSGVQLGHYPVALLLVAVLATDSLSETAEKVRILATAKSTDGQCPLTGEKTFVEAIARVLDMAHHNYWQKIIDVTVHRASGSALISYADERSRTDSIFATQARLQAMSPASTKLRINAILTRDLIIDTATDLKKISESEQQTRSAILQGAAELKQRIRPRGRKRGRAKGYRLKEGKKP
jgi:hypothetical protein